MFGLNRRLNRMLNRSRNRSFDFKSLGGRIDVDWTLVLLSPPPASCLHCVVDIHRLLPRSLGDAGLLRCLFCCLSLDSWGRNIQFDTAVVVQDRKW